MAYNDVINAVVEATGRPDKTAYITNSVNTTIKRISALQNSFRDLTEGIATVDKTLLVHNLILPTNFRKVAYYKPFPFMKLLDPVTPDKVVVAGRELTNCYYISGSTAILRLQNGYQTDQLGWGYYLYPPTLDALSVTTNWVLDDYEDLITDIISAKVFLLTGDVATAKAMELGQSGIGARIEEIKAQSKTGGLQYIQGISKVGR